MLSFLQTFLLHQVQLQTILRYTLTLRAILKCLKVFIKVVAYVALSGTGVRASISKPTPFIYLAFEKTNPFIYLIIQNVDLFIYCL